MKWEVLDLELISLSGLEIESAHISGETIVIKLSDGRSLYVEAKLQDNKPLLNVILNS